MKYITVFFSLSLILSEQSEKGLENWSDWFHKGVVKLLEIAADKAEARTLKALEMDEVKIILIDFLFYKYYLKLNG